MNLRKYETLYLLRADLSEDVQKRVNEKIFDLISTDEGKLLQVETWGTRKTAYPVQKQSKANFFQITYAGGPNLVAKLSRLFKITEEVMKFQSLKLDDVVGEEELAQEEVVYTEKAREEQDRQGRQRGRTTRGGRDGRDFRGDRKDDRFDDGDDDDDDDDDSRDSDD